MLQHQAKMVQILSKKWGFATEFFNDMTMRATLLSGLALALTCLPVKVVGQTSKYTYRHIMVLAVARPHLQALLLGLLVALMPEADVGIVVLVDASKSTCD